MNSFYLAAHRQRVILLWNRICSKRRNWSHFGGREMKCILAVLFTLPTICYAWGERGHHTICEVATRLVKEPQLKKFLEPKGHVMGHTCNIPDIYWRDLGALSKPGDQAHFLDPENVGILVNAVPTKLDEYFSLKVGQETPQQKADLLGTLWWRVEQFFDLGSSAGKSAQLAPLPDSKNQQNPDFAFNKNVYTFMLNLGLMGHFVGDASMPFHNSADYDGWVTGHGGIHSFYETQCVAFYDINLTSEVKTAADLLVSQGYVQTGSGVEMTRKISLDSFSEKATVETLDKVLTPSKIVTDEHGLQTKTYAQREKNEIACPPFHDLIVKQMARSSATLAALWDQAYVSANKPDLNAYKLYKYPLSPDFVPADYVK